MIVQINKGHLVIPVVKGNYELVDTITIRINKSDINKIDLKKIRKLKNAVKNILFILWATNDFPNIIYQKIKKDFPEFFDDGSLNSGGLFRIDMITIFDDWIEVHLDYLKKVDHIAIDEE